MDANEETRIVLLDLTLRFSFWHDEKKNTPWPLSLCASLFLFQAAVAPATKMVYPARPVALRPSVVAALLLLVGSSSSFISCTASSVLAGDLGSSEGTISTTDDNRRQPLTPSKKSPKISPPPSPKFTTFVDISVPIDEGTNSDPPACMPKITYYNHAVGFQQLRFMRNGFPGLRVEDIPGGDGWALEKVELCTHSGTHVDAPWQGSVCHAHPHFISHHLRGTTSTPTLSHSKLEVFSCYLYSPCACRTIFHITRGVNGQKIYVKQKWAVFQLPYSLAL